MAVGDLPWDLESYRATHPGFPASSATLETYNEFDFEAFRHLGWHLTDQALAKDLGTLSYRLARCASSQRTPRKRQAWAASQRRHPPHPSRQPPTKAQATALPEDFADPLDAQP